MTAAASPVPTAPLVALVGRPNAGKSALYNLLTGGAARVGNFPGITVDLLEARMSLPTGVEARIVDLPGVYSLEANVDPATDEGVARRFLTRSGGDAVGLIVQVIDGSRLALGLRLTRELCARPERLLVVVSQADVLKEEGYTVSVEALERRLGVPVLVVSARDDGARSLVLSAIASTLSAPPTPRAAPTWDPDDLAAEARSEVSKGREVAARRRFTERVDAVLLHPVAGPVVFVALMASVFAAVFFVASPMTDAILAGVDWVAGTIGPFLTNETLRSLTVDGVLAGAGTVLGFLPQIVVLAIAIELLEATGYLARGAFLVDRLLRLAGLGGRSFVPLLMGHSCAVPAITATRIVRNPRERLVTMLVVPLMTCSARIPTYALLISALFPGHSVWFRSGLFVALYAAGALVAVLAASVLRRTVVRGKGLPMVLEMPAYRSPEPRNVLRAAWRTASQFLGEVGRVIVIASIVLWALLNISWPGTTLPDDATDAQRMERSIAAHIGRGLEPVTAPLGFDWRVNVGLIGSFGARELMVSTLGIIHGVENAEDEPEPLAQQLRETRAEDGRQVFSLPTGLALMAFFVIACQCTSTLATVRRETKSWRWPAFLAAYTYGLAWVVAWGVRSVALVAGL